MRTGLRTFATLLLSALVAALALPACSSSSAPAAPADEIEAVPFKSTTTLSVADLVDLSPDTGDGKLVFKHAPAALASVARGNVLVATVSPATPMGLMRIVKTVTRSGDTLTLDTLNAPPQVAFEKLHMKIQPRSSGPLGALSGKPNDVSPRSLHPLGGPSASETMDLDIMLFDGDGDPTTTDDQVELTGSIGGTVSVGFTFDFDWGLADSTLPDAAVSCLEAFFLGPAGCLLELLPEAKATLGADAQLSTKVQLTGAALADFSKTFDILDVPLDPIALYPVPIIPVITITAGVEGGASAGFSAGVHGSVEVTTGVTVSSRHLDTPSVQSPQVSKIDFGADTPAVTLAAHLKASIGAQANILIAGVVGPYASADVFAELKADLTKNPCWGLDLGVDAALGLTVKPTLPLVGSVTLFDWHAPSFSIGWPVASGSCTIPPNSSSLPPGSGADGSHYANPTFTPWARLASSPVDGSFASSPTGDDLGWTDLLRTIDGRYLVTGSGVTEPLKLDAPKAALTWARRYHEGDASGPALSVLRSVQQPDATLMELTQSSDVASFGLLHAGVGGGIYGYQTLSVADTNCAPSPHGLAADGAGGVYVIGTCNDMKRGFVAHVAADGTLAFARTLADPTGGGVTPTAVVTVLGGASGVAADVVVAGELLAGSSSSIDQMFAVRLDPTGKPVFTRSYLGCPDAQDVAPNAGVANTNGDVTFVGSSSAHHVGFLGRLRADGSVAFASFPGLSLGVATVFVVNSVAELPTTGYVVGGSTVDVNGSGVAATAATAVVGLDAIGHTLWSRRLTLLDAGQPVASGFPGVRLSDDGGVVVAATAQAAGGGVGGRIWAFEAIAKDGTLPGLDPARAREDDLGIKDVVCGLTAGAWTPALATLAITTASAPATAEPVTLTLEHVTP